MFFVPCEVRTCVAWLPRVVSVRHVPSTASQAMPVLQSSLAEHSCVQYEALPASRHMPVARMLWPRHFVDGVQLVPAGSASLCLIPMYAGTAITSSSAPRAYDL